MKGHLKQEPQNIYSKKAPSCPSTKIKPEVSLIQEDKAWEFFITISTKESGSTYSDLTVIYPVTSSQGNKDIVVCYDFDTNRSKLVFE